MLKLEKLLVNREELVILVADLVLNTDNVALAPELLNSVLIALNKLVIIFYLMHRKTLSKTTHSLQYA